jgi:hypothetical protein
VMLLREIRLACTLCLRLHLADRKVAGKVAGKGDLDQRLINS